MAEVMTTEAVKKPKVKEGPFDITKTVEVKATDKAPYHKDGEVIHVSQFVADKMKLNGWAK